VELVNLEGIWDKKHPIVIRSWKDNWNELSTYLTPSYKVCKLKNRKG